MANYVNLKAQIDANVYQNDSQAITGAIMNAQLKAMVDALGAGYQFMGIATPTTNPGTPDQKVFYLVSQPGTYTNFGGLVVNDGEVCALVYSTSWSKKVTGAATAEQVSSLMRDAVINAILSGAVTYSNIVYDPAMNVVSATITYPDGVSGAISNVVVVNGAITSMDYTYGSSATYRYTATYDAGGNVISTNISRL